ncbi:glucose-methanol-choline oxidoreductase [Nemania abortiva]|nr:glucose-methanol-choline oxidoreductase [Nemania abortiva]
MKSHIRTLCLIAASTIGVNGVRPLGSSFGVLGNDATYDYVVVGGGTAGLTVASRLVEQGAGTVAIIEAGTFYETTTGSLMEIPADAFAWAGKLPTDWQPLADWGYHTVPQVGAYNAKLKYPRGKMLGGSSARNFMIYHRGTKGSYQKWADMVGDDGYTFENLLPYFQKSVHLSPPRNDLRLKNATPEYDPSVFGAGPLGLSYPNWVYAFPTWATKAFSQIGLYLRPEGFNSGGLIGQAYTPFSIDGKTMIRSSSETAFLQNSLNSSDYFVYPLTDAKQVLFDGLKRATGVRVDTAGRQYTISARKEVIMAAGAIGSPQLLQVSGVGPSELLQSYDIEVISDLPGVGQNLQDHVLFGISQGVNLVTASNLAGDPAFFQEQTRLYNEQAAGLLTTPGVDLLAWEKLPNATRSSFSKNTLDALKQYPADWPEVEYLALSAWVGNVSVLTFDPEDGTAYSTLAVALVAPRSRGTVNITSADAADPPAIDPRFLTDRADVEVLIAGFKRAREFYNQSSLTEVLVGPEAYPGSSVETDAQIEEHIRRNFNTVYHPSSTCSMGRRGDPQAVVDTQGRVYGVEGLRVVDASVFPLLPPGHPQATVYALAEKLACDISGNCP